MARMSSLERREALRKKTKEDIKNKGFNGNDGIIDASGYENAQFFDPKEGKKIKDGVYSISIDILPYDISSKNHPLVVMKKVKLGDPDYVLEYFTHGNIGPENKVVLCLKRTFGKPCPICEEYTHLKSEGVDKKTLSKFYPSPRVLFNVIDKQHPDKGIQLFKVSSKLFFTPLKEKIEIEEAEGEEEITPSDLEVGCTIKCHAIDTTKGSGDEIFNFVEYKDFSFAKRSKPYPESILDEVYPLDVLLKVPTYDEIKKIFLSIEDTKKNDEEEEIKPRGRKSKIVEKKEETTDSKQQIDENDQIKDTENDDSDNQEVDQELNNEDNPDTPFSVEECSEGYTFGKDYDQQPECSECNEDRWNNCADKCDELKKEEEEVAKKKEEGKTRRHIKK